MRRYSPNKDLNDFANEMAANENWTITSSGGNHLKWTHPSGATFFTGSTPSCSRVMDNVRRDMKRAFMRVGVDPHPMSKIQYQIRQQKIKRREEKMQKPLTQGMPAIALPTPKLFQKETIFVKVAHSKMMELIRQGKSSDDAVTIVTAAFRIVDPIHKQEVPVHKLVEVSKNPTWGIRGPSKKKKSEKQSPPPSAQTNKEVVARIERAKRNKDSLQHVKLKPTNDLIDESMRHIRALIDMPLEKQKKLDIAIDLLDKLL